MSHHAKWEYLQAIHARYRQSPRALKRQILDEFCQVTGYHRKYAIRLLRGPARRRPAPRRGRRATYGVQLVSVLGAIWEAAGCPWSVRLKALRPLWLPWARQRFRLSPPLEQALLAISPR